MSISALTPVAKQAMSLLSKAEQAIDKCGTLKDGQELRRQIAAILAYLKQKREKNFAVIRKADELRFRLDCKIGEFSERLDKLSKAQAGSGKAGKNKLPASKRDQLHAVGISKQQANRLERLSRFARSNTKIIEQISSDLLSDTDERKTIAAAVVKALREHERQKERPESAPQKAFDASVDELTIKVRRFFDRLLDEWPSNQRSLLAALLRGLAEEAESINGND